MEKHIESKLPFSYDVSILNTQWRVGETIFPNRLAIQPMEGADSLPDGAPGELTLKRYEKFAKSGAGLIWFEAVAVQEDGRGNPGQLWLTEENVMQFRDLVSHIKETAQNTTGITPVVIMQATHSGRYAKPYGKPAPVIAYKNPLFEKDSPIDDSRIITDDELESLEKSFFRAAVLAQKAGFDGIDLKCCHRYLASELLSAFTRKGKYGGSFENRTRFYCNIVKAARQAAKDGFLVTSRLNVYDGFPYPYGFGVSENGGIEPDLTEPIRLIRELDFDLLNITIGNPYVNPEVNRPLCLSAVERMYTLTKKIQDAFPKMTIVSSAPTYLKENAGYLAAGAVKEGYCKIVGFGRMAFAYPDFAKDILKDQFDKKQTCVTCGKCTELLRAGQNSGCVVRNPYYTALYREVVKK